MFLPIQKPWYRGPYKREATRWRDAVSPDDRRNFYNTEGYVHLRNVLPSDLLELTEYVLRRWSNVIFGQWIEEGLIEDPRTDIDFQHRFVKLYLDAGKPKYSRSPRRDLVCPEMYQILVHRVLLDLAEDLLGTSEISVHGIFNGRAKLPDQIWTDTSWHQDAQYYRDAEHTHTVSMWYPLQRVTEENSCLQVAPRLHGGILFEGHKDEETGFLGLSHESRKNLEGLSIEMERGDVFCFHQKTPHRALPNRSDAVRWSLDVRYEATEHATESGKIKGLIARSTHDPSTVTPYEEWHEKWADAPKGSY